MSAMSPVPFRRADLAGLSYATLTKDTNARLYVVPLAPPLVVQTTPVQLASGLDDPSVPFVFVPAEGALGAFFRDAEAAVLDACVANKDTWFAKKFDDDTVRRGFKSFFSENGFKLKVPADVACFDAARRPIGREDLPAGSTVRLVLELGRVSFGRHEFGATWKVMQALQVPTECLFTEEPDPAEAEAEPEADDSDADEFM